MFRSVIGAVANMAETAYDAVLGPAAPSTKTIRTVTISTPNLDTTATTVIKKELNKSTFIEDYAPPQPPKEPPQIPLRARPLKKYGFTEDQEQIEGAKSAHLTNLRHPKKNGIDNKKKSAYIKNNNNNEFASEIEAAVYEFYYYLCPENTTPTHALYKIDSKGNIVFTKVASDTLNEFSDLTTKPLCKEDFQKDEKNPEKYYRFIKDLARIFTTSQIGNEDDLHFGNIAWVKINDVWRLARIDYDMSRWPIHYLFKDYSDPSQTYLGMVKSYFNEPLRNANTNLFTATTEDIDHSPVFTSPATPSEFAIRIGMKNFFPRYHWVGRGFIAQTQTSQASSSGKKSSSTSGKVSNPSTDPTFVLRNELIKVSKNPIYIKEKFIIFLKYILSDANFHSDNNQLHLRKDAQKDGKNLISMFYEYEKINLKEYEDALIKSPSFLTFLTEHGDSALQEIMKEMKMRRLTLYKKMFKNNHELELFQKLSVNFNALPDSNDEKIRIKEIIKDRIQTRNKYLIIANQYFIDDSTYKKRFQQLKERAEIEYIKTHPDLDENEFTKVDETPKPPISSSLPKYTDQNFLLFSEERHEEKEKKQITRSQSTNDLKIPKKNYGTFTNRGYSSN